MGSGEPDVIRAQIEAIRVIPCSPQEQHRAALVICERALGPGDAAGLLRALGLATPAHARVWRHQDRVLGHKRGDGGR